jgi:hypothetical protein
MLPAMKVPALLRAKGKPSALDEKEMKPAVEWLCSGGPIHFVRGVLPSGLEEEDGYACKGEAEVKYYSRDSFSYEEGFESKCVSVSYDEETKTHKLF